MKILQHNFLINTLASRLWRHFCNDSFFRNSAYIMLATGVMSAFGFIFWIICSRLYTASEIGLATSLLSVASLLTSLSLFGLNKVLIRFLPTSNTPNSLISAVLVAVSIGSILSGILFLLWAHLTNNPIMQLGAFIIVAPIFIGYLFLQTTGIIFDSIFIANRNAKYIFFRNTLFSVAKLALPLFFIALGSVGIIYSIATATLLAWIAGLLWVTIIFNFKLISPNTRAIDGMKRFATGNYVGNIFGMLPASLLPLIIISKLGTQEAAYFYMPLMIVTLINVIPSANAQSLFAEVSNNEAELASHLRKAFRHLFMLLLPVVVTVEVSAHLVLSFFGPEYAQAGTIPLQILAVASLIGSLNYFGDTILNIKKRSVLYITMNTFNSLIIIILSYCFASYGLTAIAIAWLVAQIITMLVYLLINRRLIVEIWGLSPKIT